MSQHRADSASPPGPLSTYVERGSALALALGAFLIAGCQPSGSLVQRQTDGHADLRAEVQAFYDWYLEPNHDGRTVGTVLIERPQVLAAELRALLQADRSCVAEAQAICNLDFDPFLNSQDPCAKYEVREQVADSGTPRFNVYAVCSGERGEVPDLQVTVQPLDSGWVFVNMDYGMEGTDLLTLLRRPVTR
jgi:hypothetical protein